MFICKDGYGELNFYEICQISDSDLILMITKMQTANRIIKIHKIEGFKVYCLFNNGDSRVIDFTSFQYMGNQKGLLPVPYNVRH
jgi:hypothetical protein